MQTLGVSVRDDVHLLREDWRESSSVAVTYVAFNEGVGAGFRVAGILPGLLMRDVVVVLV